MSDLNGYYAGAYSYEVVHCCRRLAGCGGDILWEGHVYGVVSQERTAYSHQVNTNLKIGYTELLKKF